MQPTQGTAASAWYRSTGCRDWRLHREVQQGWAACWAAGKGAATVLWVAMFWFCYPGEQKRVLSAICGELSLCPPHPSFYLENRVRAPAPHSLVQGKFLQRHQHSVPVQPTQQSRSPTVEVNSCFCTETLRYVYNFHSAGVCIYRASHHSCTHSPYLYLTDLNRGRGMWLSHETNSRASSTKDCTS